MRIALLVFRGFLAIGALSALLLSYLGSVHGIGDTLAVARVPLAVTVMAAAFLWRRDEIIRTILVAYACLVLAHTAIVRVPLMPSSHGISIYQKNLLAGSDEIKAVAQDILQHAPDIITLQEVSARKAPLLDELASIYSTVFSCPTKGQDRGTAILSKWSIRPGTQRCSLNGKLAILQVDGPSGPLWVASVHLSWPWPYSQAINASYARQFLGELDGPVVYGGDFNMLPWGSSVRSLARATQTQRARLPQATFWIRDIVPVQIDHVFGPNGGSAELRPLYGSDHFGVLAKVPL